MRTEDHFDKWLYRGLFLLLAVMSVYFFKERLFADSSYMIFHTINKGWFHIEHGRPAHGITQCLPLMGYAFHLPLKYLLILYSLGQVVFFYIVYWLLYKVLERPSAAIAVVGLMLIGQSQMYYIPMLEIVIGAALSVLILAIMRSEKWKDDKWLILLLLSFWLVLTSHPLNFLLALVILIYDIADRGWKKKLHYSMIFFYAAAIFIEFIGHDSYEAQKVVAIEDSGLTNLLSYEFLVNASILFLKNYWLMVILGIWTSIHLYRKREGLLFLIWPVSFVLILLGAIYRWDISGANWYTELVFSPLVSITLILFVFVILETNSLKNQLAWKKAFGIFYLILALGIVNNSEEMQDRMSQMEQISDQLQVQKIDKAIIEYSNIDRPYNHWEWSVPVEVLLLSAIDGPTEAVSLITDNDLDYNYNRKRLTDSSFVFRMFEVMSYEELNQDYFQMEKGGYQRINTSKNIADVLSMKDQIKIHPPKEDSIYKVKAGMENWIDVVIENSSDKILPSALENYLFVAPHWYHSDTLVEWDGSRTPMELDILGAHQQQIRLQAPEMKGIYEVQLDLVKEGEYWMMYPEKFIVQVY